NSGSNRKYFHINGLLPLHLELDRVDLVEEIRDYGKRIAESSIFKDAIKNLNGGEITIGSDTGFSDWYKIISQYDSLVMLYEFHPDFDTNIRLQNKLKFLRTTFSDKLKAMEENRLSEDEIMVFSQYMEDEVNATLDKQGWYQSID
ncbi:MAG: hypothetical protein AB8G05_15565, partial [Oligoflexales bacterium]